MYCRALFAIAAMAAAALLWAPQAAAQPDLTDRGWEYTHQNGTVICASVDLDPTVDGFSITLDRVAQDGFSVYEASGIMIAALSAYCPRNYWLVGEFIDAYPAAPPERTAI